MKEINNVIKKRVIPQPSTSTCQPPTEEPDLLCKRIMDHLSGIVLSRLLNRIDQLEGRIKALESDHIQAQNQSNGFSCFSPSRVQKLQMGISTPSTASPLCQAQKFPRGVSCFAPSATPSGCQAQNATLKGDQNIPGIQLSERHMECGMHSPGEQNCPCERDIPLDHKGTTNGVCETHLNTSLKCTDDSEKMANDLPKEPINNTHELSAQTKSKIAEYLAISYMNERPVTFGELALFIGVPLTTKRQLMHAIAEIKNDLCKYPL
jgi:translation elongation factor EF-1beta